MVETPHRFGETASERLEVVDSLWFNPEERAALVLGLIEAGRQHLDTPYDPSFYDMLCFACQWLGRVSTHELPDDKEFYQLAVKLNQWLYSRHYFHTREILGEPDKKEKVDAERRQESAGQVRGDSAVSSGEPTGEDSGSSRQGPPRVQQPDEGDRGGDSADNPRDRRAFGNKEVEGDRGSLPLPNSGDASSSSELLRNDPEDQT